MKLSIFFKIIFKLFLLITDIVQLTYMDVKIVNLRKYLRLGGFFDNKNKFLCNTRAPRAIFLYLSDGFTLFQCYNNYN